MLVNLVATSKPVFVIGPVRSGSTFLRLMLDFHPKITNPGECDFLFDMVSDDGGLPDVNVYTDWLSANRIFQAKRLEIDTTLPYDKLMQSFLLQLNSKGAVLAMNVHRHFHRIPYVFPDARYIRLLRDPRDVARSCIGMGWVGHVYYGVDIWTEAEQSWQRLRSQLTPNQYLGVRYEDLVNEPEATLTAICRFLGLPYSDQMMGYASQSTYAPPDKSLAYQWKKKYSKRELQLVEGKLGRQLSDLGYEPSGHEPSKPRIWELFQLYLQHRQYRALYQIKRYGIRLYIENAIATRIGSKSWQYSCRRRKNIIDIQHLK